MERKIAYEILCNVLIDNQYASLALKKRLIEVPPIKRGFITELVNGVLRHYYLLTYQFSNLTDKKPKKNLEILLAMAVYERFYLKKEKYVTNEYIELATSKIEKGFINAIMRKCNIFLQPDLNTDEGKAIYYSLPLWLFKMLKAQYDNDTLEFILNDLNNIPRVFYRLNHKKCTYDDLKDININRINDDSFVCENSLINSRYFKDGYFYIQDLNSASIYKELDLKADDIYLDLCAAPGSKLFNALDIIQCENAYVNDLNANRLKLIIQKGQELGFEDFNILNEDASKLDPQIINKATKILIDAPCSGLGVLKRKPDIRYRIKGEDIDEIVKIQRDILNHVLSNMQIGAICVYSTCTLNTKENNRQIANILKNHSNIELLDEKLYLDNERADRFYSAKLLKIA